MFLSGLGFKSAKRERVLEFFSELNAKLTYETSHLGIGDLRVSMLGLFDQFRCLEQGFVP